MGKRTKQKHYERLIEELRKCGVHAEIAKPRAELSVYKRSSTKIELSAQEVSSV
ncbi:hypothetical protein [Thermaerobacillus caldiproteolyticus]|uniref:Uncharacterized protein n=1 Tax=Thermaerobacillus caldiproteolyticus TaxID=247480 RepID=A0A7V9Z5R4_9BACL|nr:hypothetical protein [Anoxybacillus caldiproteolyticus]MBA2874534.1 hypothetical protein [Anoxybacillus caldiproteolyticus]QPA30785.1 hypothetical protein ISX45_14630 [Anoxybacillus caldiproteolyticus]